MRQPHLPILFTMVLLMGCFHSVQKVKLIPGAELVIDLPFDPTLIPIGYCDRGDTSASFYYFANFRTAKKIACCNQQGKVFKTIDLKPWIKDRDLWYTMQVRSLDSFAAISAEENQLFLFNSDGLLLHQTGIPRIKYKHVYYKLYNGPQQPDQGWGNCYADIGLTYEPFFDTTTGKLDWDAWHAVANPGPALARITGLFSGNPTVSLQLEDILMRAVRPGEATASYFTYTNSDTRLFYTNCYSDTLYRFDGVGNLTGMVPLKSSYSNIGARPRPITDDGNAAQAHSDSIRDIKGVIQYAKYDKYRKLIYLMLYHEVPGDSKPMEKGEHRAWSMFIYNEELEKLAEVPFKANTYLPDGLIVNPQGFLLKKMDNRQDDQTYRQVFQQFIVSM